MAEQRIELRQYVRAIGKRFWLVLLMVAVAVGTVWMWPTPLSTAGRAPATYSASASILVTAPVITPAPPATVGGDGADFRVTQGSVAGDIVQLIGSRAIATRVAERLNLSNPGQIQRNLSASPVRGSAMIRITATARDPQRAAEIANTAAEELISYFRETNRASMAETRRFIEEQLAQARARLDASDRAIQAFKENKGMASVETIRAQMLSAIATGQTDLDAATTALRETEARLTAARDRLNRESPVMVASRATSDNPVFRRYQDRLVDLEITRATLAQSYTPQHPRMEQVTREIAEIRSKLTAEARTSIAQEITATNPTHTRLVSDIVTMEVERAAAAARLQALQVAQRRRQAAVSTLPSAESEYLRLVRENRILESNYTSLATRYQEAVLREQQAGFFPASLQVVETARPPQRANTTFPITAAAAAALGLLLGAAGALFLETLDDRIRDAQEAERVLGAPVLAEIPMQGAVRTAPSPAVLALIGIVVAGLVAFAGYAYTRRSAIPADSLRTVAATVMAWVNPASSADTAAVNAR
ncbi:MAG: hypothetical protein QN178_06190 [Armatimonadota bacterium]|nr:hypothetical protein [Armatimonadota bacterium]